MRNPLSPTPVGPSRHRGFSLLEVLLSLSILLAGIVGIVWFFPDLMRTKSDAAFLSEAALLAQMKAEQIRRDDDTTGTMVQAIAALTQPTTAITFAEDPRLSYCFSGVSLLYPPEESPRGDSGVARVIVRYSEDFRKARRPDATDNVIYELRFGP